MRNLILKIAFIWFALLVFPMLSEAKPVTFLTNNELGKDNVSFTSDAPIELIVGRTTMINGKIIIDDSLDLHKLPINVLFDVDLASLDTGILLRDEHMRDNFLETKKYPKAVFKVKKIMLESPGKLVDGKPLKLMAEGDLSIHGNTVKKNIPVKVTYFKESDFTHNRFKHGDVIKIQSTFDVPLAEHKIKRPEILWQKLTDTVAITIDASSSSSEE